MKLPPRQRVNALLWHVLALSTLLPPRIWTPLRLVRSIQLCYCLLNNPARSSSILIAGCLLFPVHLLHHRIVSVNSRYLFAHSSSDHDYYCFNWNIGAPRLIRHLTFTEMRKVPIKEIILEEVLNQLKMTMDQVYLFIYSSIYIASLFI